MMKGENVLSVFLLFVFLSNNISVRYRYHFYRTLPESHVEVVEGFILQMEGGNHRGSRFQERSSAKFFEMIVLLNCLKIAFGSLRYHHVQSWLHLVWLRWLLASLVWKLHAVAHTVWQLRRFSTPILFWLFLLKMDLRCSSRPLYGPGTSPVKNKSIV